MTASARATVIGGAGVDTFLFESRPGGALRISGGRAYSETNTFTLKAFSTDLSRPNSLTIDGFEFNSVTAMRGDVLVLPGTFADYRFTCDVAGFRVDVKNSAGATFLSLLGTSFIPEQLDVYLANGNLRFEGT